MKKLAKLFTLLVFIIAFAIPVFAASDSVEVPVGSWEYNSVAQLAAKGYFTDYTDGLGGNPITRDEVGAMLANALPVDMSQMSGEDVYMMERLVAEFKAEILNHGVKEIRTLEDVDKINPTWL